MCLLVQEEPNGITCTSYVFFQFSRGQFPSRSAEKSISTWSEEFLRNLPKLSDPVLQATGLQTIKFPDCRKCSRPHIEDRSGKVTSRAVLCMRNHELQEMLSWCITYMVQIKINCFISAHPYLSVSVSVQSYPVTKPEEVAEVTVASDKD